MYSANSVFKILMVAVLTVAMVSCTKSKRNKFKVQPKATTESTTEGAGTPVDTSSGTQLPDDVESETDVTVVVDETDSSDNSDNANSGDGSSDGEGGGAGIGSGPVVVIGAGGGGSNSGLGSSTGGSDSSTAYNALNPNEVLIYRERNETGRSQNDSVYTGSSTDDILNQAREALDSLTSFNQQSIDSYLASRIKAVRASQTEKIAIVKVDLTEVDKEVSFSGDFKVDAKSKIKMAQLTAKNLPKGVSIKGTMYCLDKDGECENAIIRFYGSAKGKRGNVVVVSRNTLASLNVVLQNKSTCASTKALVDFIDNSQANKAETDEKIKAIRLKTFEVVGGRSGFSLVLIGANKELVDLRSYLLAKPQSTEAGGINVMASKDKIEGYKSSYMSAFVGAKLLNNNGLGQIKIQAQLKACEAGEASLVDMTVMRNTKEVRSLQEVAELLGVALAKK